MSADKMRAFNSPGTFAKAHISAGGNPIGHGFTNENVANNTAYWIHDLANIRLISIDTVNPHGGWQGSIDEKQLMLCKLYRSLRFYYVYIYCFSVFIND